MPNPPFHSRTRFGRPGKVVGIIGGGQLAKMTAQAAYQLGCDVVILEKSLEFPAGSLDTSSVVGDWNDPVVLRDFGERADVITLENEFVDAGALAALETQHAGLAPSAACIRTVQDKLVQKETFHRLGLPLPRFADAARPEAALRFADECGWPVVLKKRMLSYDGRGNATVNQECEMSTAWHRLDGRNSPLYVEEYCPFVAELAVIVTRARWGEVVSYPVVETVNRNHVCHVVKAPANVDANIANRVAELARRAVEGIDGIGSMALEMFLLADGTVLINEIAPRVHNTGHYTIEACVCSQFENHVRAVLGLPLGSPAMRTPGAAMVNLLGAGDGAGEPHGLAGALGVPGAHVHIYGKARSAKGRKMGHVTAIGSTTSDALACAIRAADRIRFGEPT